MKISDLCYIVLDTETAPRRMFQYLETEVIEFAWVRVENLKIVDSKSFLIKPAYKIPGEISDLLGITNDMVEGASSIGDIMEIFVKDLQDCVIVGHNIRYDISSIRESLNRGKSNAQLGEVFENKSVIDTMGLFSKLYPSNRKRLKDLMDMLGVKENAKRHRALADTEYTVEVFLKMVDVFLERYKTDSYLALEQFLKTGNPNIQQDLF